MPPCYNPIQEITVSLVLGCYMHFIQPMHAYQQACVSHHQQVACGETHIKGILDGVFLFGCWRGTVMESDHDLALKNFRNNNPNCNWEV